MRSTLQQQNSTATHALLNALEGQNGLGNETINHVWLMLFGDELSNVWIDVHMTMMKSDPEPVINLLDPEQFHEHYQKLAPMREKQKQCLEEINT
ncbi:hypothetical protein G9A89_006428 [Geosiphon pyriformis]|nr:hypothetical protein G9A89_006428 [Geosiphon pyriformis]